MGACRNPLPWPTIGSHPVDRVGDACPRCRVDGAVGRYVQVTSGYVGVRMARGSRACSTVSPSMQPLVIRHVLRASLGKGGCSAGRTTRPCSHQAMRARRSRSRPAEIGMIAPRMGQSNRLWSLQRSMEARNPTPSSRPGDGPARIRRTTISTDTMWFNDWTWKIQRAGSLDLSMGKATRLDRVVCPSASNLLNILAHSTLEEIGIECLGGFAIEKP